MLGIFGWVAMKTFMNSIVLEITGLGDVCGLEGNWSASYLGIPPTKVYNYSPPDLLLTCTGQI